MEVKMKGSILLLLLVTFGCLFLSSVSDPLCNGNLFLTSFSGSSNGNYQVFDSTTTPALPTTIANEEVLTFSFWWQYSQPTDANIFTLFRLDQSAGDSSSFEAFRVILQLDTSKPEFLAIFPTNSSYNVTLVNTVNTKVLMSSGTWYWTLVSVDYTNDRVTCYLYKFGKNILIQTQAEDESFAVDTGKDWKFTSDLKMYVGGDTGSSGTSIFTIETLMIYPNIYVDNTALSYGPFLTADQHVPIFHLAASSHDADYYWTLIDGVEGWYYGPTYEVYQPRVMFDEQYVWDFTFTRLNWVPIWSYNTLQTAPHYSFTFAIKFKAYYSYSLPTNCSYNVIFNRRHWTDLNLYSIGYANNKSVIIEFLWFTFDTGITLEAEGSWNTLVVSCFPVVIGTTYFCEINGQSMFFTIPTYVNYYTTDDYDWLYLGHIGCAAPIKMAWVSYHYGGGGNYINTGSSASVCGTADCSVTIHANTDNSTCLEKLCASGEAFDADYATLDCVACSGTCTQCNDAKTCVASSSSCTSSQYLTVDGSCADCDSNCVTCVTEANFCTSCISTYYMTHKDHACSYTSMCNEKYIDDSCNDCIGQYWINFTWNDATNMYDENCATCGTNCDFCWGPSYCLHCTTGTFLNVDTECEFCDGNCKNCVDEATTCTSCYPGMLLDGTICCPEGCLACTTTNICTSCLDGYNFINNTCVAGCPVNHVEVDSACYCSNYETTHCQQCPDNLNTCTECMSGYMLRPNGTCGTACPEDYFYSNKKCISASVRITTALKAQIDAWGEKLNWLLAETLVLLMMMFIYY